MIYENSRQLASVILKGFKYGKGFSLATKTKVLKEALIIIKNSSEKEKEEMIKSLNKE